METRMRRCIRAAAAVFMIVMISGLSALQAVYANEILAQAQDPAYLKAAKAAYGIENVYYCSEYNGSIVSALAAAQDEASKSDPIIVYADDQRYTVSTKKAFSGAGAVSGIYIPENVVLVGEADTVIKDKTSNASKPLILVGGSIYGFRVECGKRSQSVVKYKNDMTYSTAKSPSGKQINGNTEKVEVVAPGLTGIHAIGAKNINIKNNIVRDSKVKKCTGISIMYGAKATTVSGNKISNIGASGFGSAISLCHADAVAIDKNVIKNVAGHGISTDTDQKGKSHAYCRVRYIRKNSINGAKDGIWLENKCQVTDSMSGNTINNCKVNGIGIEALSKYKNTKAGSIAAMTGNTIKNSTRSNLSIVGKYGVVRMKSGNVISGCRKTNNVTLDKKAKLYITGSKNKITTAYGYGIYVCNGSYLSINGTTSLTKNKSYALGIIGKSKAVVKKANLKGNTKGSARVGKGSTLKLLNCKKDKIVKVNTVN